MSLQTNGFRGVFLIACGSLLLAGCRNGSTGEARGGRPTGPAPVTVARVEARSVPVTLRSVGTVEAVQRVTLRAEVGGVLVRTGFQEGDDVKAGQLLFQIDPRTYEADLRRAEAALARDEAQLAQAERQARRYEELVKKNYVTTSQDEDARTQVDVAKATVNVDREAVAFARLQLERTSVKAPTDGRAGAYLAHVGDLIKAGDAVLTTIQQIRPIRVGFALPADRLPEVQARSATNPLPVTVRTGPDKATVHRGALCFIDNAVDRETGTILLKAQFPNEDATLWPGQFVDVELLLDTEAQAIVVPSQAVQNGQNLQFVFVVRPDSTVEKRTVEVLRQVDGYTVIASGVATGETVVTDGQIRLVPNAKVELQPPRKAEGAAP
jgi:membrane fusion protein, multidrug efflux system